MHSPGLHGDVMRGRRHVLRPVFDEVTPRFRGLSDGSAARRRGSEVLVDLLDRERAIADGTGNTSGRSAPDITGGIEPGEARGVRGEGSAAGVPAGQDASPLVPSDRNGQPVGSGPPADQNKQPVTIKELTLAGGTVSERNSFELRSPNASAISQWWRILMFGAARSSWMR